MEVSLKKHWTFIQFQNTSSRREDFMATDVGKLQKRKNIIWPIFFEKEVHQEKLHRDP